MPAAPDGHLPGEPLPEVEAFLHGVDALCGLQLILHGEFEAGARLKQIFQGFRPDPGDDRKRHWPRASFMTRSSGWMCRFRGGRPRGWKCVAHMGIFDPDVPGRHNPWPCFHG